MVDKDLFLHDLAVVAILKNEGPYLKEWLDYHLLAGVDHFYLYDNNDNDSLDNQAEVAKPYVKARLVDWFPFPGTKMQYVSYHDAIKRFKFQSRYMAFIDCDEFIYPLITNGGGIVKLIDEILSHDPHAAGLGIKWHVFGSNGQEKADLSRGVLERFTRREKDQSQLLKSIVNPRKVYRKLDAHSQDYFAELYSIDESGRFCNRASDTPAKKIIINHYLTKSREEYLKKLLRGSATGFSTYSKDRFARWNRNNEFDDGILKYRDERAKGYQPPDKSNAYERLLCALERNLSSTFQADTPSEFYEGKIETFLTCRAVASYLQTKLSDTAQARLYEKAIRLYEEAALKAILKSLKTRYTFADAGLLVKELPDLLKLPYPVVADFRKL